MVYHDAFIIIGSKTMSGKHSGGFWRNALRRRYLSREDEKDVVMSTGETEKGNRGEVRVHMEARRFEDDLLMRAAALFRAR